MNNFSLALLILLLSIYFVKLGIPGLVYLSVFVMLLVLMVRGKWLRVAGDDIGVGFSMVGLILTILINAGQYSAVNMAFVVNLIGSLIVFYALLSFGSALNWVVISRYVFRFFIIIASFDTLYKLLNPVDFDIDLINDRTFLEFGFYQYKGSFFYKDSNGLGFLLLPMILLGRELHQRLNVQEHGDRRRFYIYYNIIPSLIIILTFSRSAIISAILINILIRIKYGKYNYILALMVTLLFSLFSAHFLDLVGADLSGGTKVNEFMVSIQQLKYANIDDLLLGVGFGNGEILTGRFIHGAMNKIFIELGILGLTFYLLMFLCLFIKPGVKSLLVGLLVMSFSSNFYFFPPFVMAVFSLIVLINKYHKIPKIIVKGVGSRGA